MNPISEFPFTDGIEGLEETVKTYFSSFTAEPEFKHTLRTYLKDEIKHNPAKTGLRFVSGRLFAMPIPKWAVGLLTFLVICLSSFAIRPVRQAFGKAFNLGYLENVGFVKINETYILNQTIEVNRGSQTVSIDQVVMDAERITIWLHSTGEPLFSETSNGGTLPYLEAEGQQYPASSWGWVDDSQSGVIQFSVSLPPISLVISLHLAPDWIIPIQLTLMSESSDDQAVILFSDLCKSHIDVKLCLQAFVTDSTGYHLLLNATSSNPDFYLEDLFMFNPGTSESVQLLDSTGNPLQESSVSSPDFPIPLEIPVEVIDSQREVESTLNYSPPLQKIDVLTLTVPGLIVKTPVDQTITCTLDSDPVIGSIFPCETSTIIYGNELTFHSGEIIQGQTGLQLQIFSDTVQPIDNLLLTGVDFEILEENTPLLGTSFEVKTHQLVLFWEPEDIHSGQTFNIHIYNGYLTILESYQLSWPVSP